MRKDGIIEYWTVEDFTGRTSGMITYNPDGTAIYECNTIPDISIICGGRSYAEELHWCDTDILAELKPGEEIPVINSRAHCKKCFERVQRRRGQKARSN